MPSTKSYLWACPNGCPSVRASSRPRKDDVARFCLKCSAKTGRLVPRSCPSLDRAREAKAKDAVAKRQAQAKRDVARERAKVTVAGIHLPTEAAAVIRAAGWRTLKATDITFHVRRCMSEPTSRFGSAWPWAEKIMLADYPGITPEDVCETLTHELVHLHVGGSQSDHRWHGRSFKEELSRVFEAAYGVRGFGARDNVYHGRYAKALRWHRASTKTLLRERDATPESDPQHLHLTGLIRQRGSHLHA